MTVMNPKQIQKNSQVFNCLIHNRGGCNSWYAKIQKANYYILIFSFFFCLNFVAIWSCRCFSWPNPTLFHKGEQWLGQKEIQDRAAVLWPDESPVEQAGLRCLWLPLIAVSSSALGLVTLDFAEGEFSERTFPSNYFLYLPFLCFCDLMSLVLIPESRRGEAGRFLLLGMLYGGQIVILGLVQDKSYLVNGIWCCFVCERSHSSR